MYKSFGVRCDVHTWHPYIGRSWLQVQRLLEFWRPTLYFWLRTWFEWNGMSYWNFIFCWTYALFHVPFDSVRGRPSPPKSMMHIMRHALQILDACSLCCWMLERSDDRPPRCVFLGDVKDSLGGQEWLDGECLEQVV